MDVMTEYLENVRRILADAIVTQHEAMEQGARKMAEATLSGHSVFAFGCSHAGLLALELYYRSGGMATINPVRAAGLNLAIDPATRTSQMERLPEYGRLIIDNIPLGNGDVILIHSVSGRNTVTVDAAMRAREKGAFVIALTSLAATTQVTSRHPSGKNLYEVADLVLDNGGCLGDGCIALEGVPEKIGPTSTAVGAALLNAMMTRAVQRVIEAGGVPPVFVSANLDGGEAHNREMMRAYRNQIFYMGHERAGE